MPKTMPDTSINGIDVNFPFEPYEVQKVYMSKVIECLQNRKHGVLESPTGTGKTLCLLCSSLSWLTTKKAQLQAQALIGAVETPNFGGKFFEKLKSELETAAGSSSPINHNAMLGWATPKIVYASRTHTQLTQVMQELKRTAYKHVKVAVIGSRDQLCIHPEVSKVENSADKIHLCQSKVRTRMCMYYNNVELRKDDPIFRDGICDIEDLVKAGNKMKCCPYFLARELKQNADITFMPYNYLLDAKTRRSQGIDLQNHVVLLDEAHNVEKTCEDAASLEISSTDIAVCIDEITFVMKKISEEETGNGDEFNFDTPNDVQKDFTPDDLCMLKSMFLAFEKAIDDVELKKDESETFPGSYIFELMEKAEIMNNKGTLISDKLDKIVLWLSTTSTSPFARHGRALQKFSDFLRAVFSGGSGQSLLKHRARVKECYKIYIQYEDNAKNSKNYGGWNSKKTIQKPEGKIISYWCFSPGFGMNQLVELGVHSIILTSGTLSPLKPFISELGIPIDVQLENPHIVKPEQICVGILSQGPDGHQLNSSYNTRNDPKYISALGRTIYNFSCLIPDGLLVFFPSYPIMKKCQADWQNSGLWMTIAQKKQIYVESQSKDGFTNTMSEFYKKIQDPTAKGAIFLAVCRGKVSEGLDFADANGRAVLITGLPYPPMMDPRVMLKQRYLDEMKNKNKETLSGQQWYQLEASRAVNQAIGRIIRHINDYGAIILCDCRFNNANFKGHLSAWLRPYIKNFPNFGIVTKQLRDFFKNATQFPHIKKKIGDFSPNIADACFETNTKKLESSSLRNETQINVVESFDVGSYKICTNTEICETTRLQGIDGSSKSAVNLVTSKVKGSWSETTWKATKETAGESISKKRKLKVQSLVINYDTPGTSSETANGIYNNLDDKLASNQNKKAVGESYLRAVKRTLSKENFQIFAKLVENYKKNGDVEELIQILEKLFPVDSESRYLFIGFKSFLKKQHIDAFECYLNNFIS